MSPNPIDLAGDPAFEVPWGPPWTPDSVIALLEPMVGDERRARIRDVLAERLASVTVLLDCPYDPHNASAVLRSCDAFGVQQAHVLPGPDGFVVSHQVAQGTERWVDVREHPDTESAVAALESHGFELVSTHPEGELVPEQLAAIPRLALVFGNEHSGLRPGLAAACRRSVRIPMRGFVESLNLSVSAALLLRAATSGRAGDLSPLALKTLYARGLYRSLSRPAEILAASAEPPHPKR